IFLNSIDRDGGASGYDLALIRAVSAATTIPVVACGGVGRYEDFAPGILEGGASAVSAANIFHFFELSYPMAKRACLDAGIPMRPIQLDNRWCAREPVYPEGAGTRIIERRQKQAQEGPPRNRPGRGRMRWCTRCVYPS